LHDGDQPPLSIDQTTRKPAGPDLLLSVGNRLTRSVGDGQHYQVIRAQDRSARRLLRRLGREERELVRLRPAWADSVLLYWGSPVPYENSGLEDDLIAELQAWDTSYYDRVGAEPEGRLPASTDAHRAEGARLAQRVADALGSAFGVEFDQRRVQSRHRPTSPDAAAAFKAHGARQQAALLTLMQQAAQDPGADGLSTTSEELPEEPGQWLREVRARTTRRVRVLISPDHYVGFPVEVVVDGRAGYVDAAMLGVSASLRRDLEEFQDWWELHAWDDEDEETNADEEAAWAAWMDQGSQLVERLQSELGDDYYVSWN
jgi:hypothetical protein